MIPEEEVMKVFPFPIRLELYVDSDQFRFYIRDSFKKLLEEHNKNYDTKIELIARHFASDKKGYLGIVQDAFEVYVGNNKVHKGTAPANMNEDETAAFYYSIVSITEQILDTWHNEIIEVQNRNLKKAQELKAEGYDEMLYAYYTLCRKSEAFLYLKKLAERYPNTKYRNILRRVYKNGNSQHKASPGMCRKLSRSRDDVEYF